MRKDTIKYADFTAPGVEVHCLYGEGYPTVERYENERKYQTKSSHSRDSSFDFRLNYKTGLGGSPTLVSGDGDGTVNVRSLRACEQWGSSPQQHAKKIHSIEISGADHMGILSDKRVVEYVLQVLVGSGDYDADESEEYDYHTYFNNRL